MEAFTEEDLMMSLMAEFQCTQEQATEALDYGHKFGEQGPPFSGSLSPFTCAWLFLYDKQRAPRRPAPQEGSQTPHK